jgi:hypothetical protein
MLRRSLFAASLGALIAMFLASPAVAASTKTVSTKNFPETMCNENGKWVFSIFGVGGSTGIAAPATITATKVGGGTVTISQSAANVPTAVNYELDGAVGLTGDATADIDAAWNPSNGFWLGSGPCAPTHTQLTLDKTIAVPGTTITLTARVTSATGPLANQSVTIRHHSLVLDGSGDELGPFTTGPDGSFTTHVVVDTLGYHDFSAEYFGSSVFDHALQMSSSDPQVLTVVPAGPPASAAGQLTSSAGTGSRKTTLSGGGFDPNTPVAIVAYSDPLAVANVTTDDNGAFSIPVTLPDGLVGQHTIVAVGSLGDDSGLAVRYLTLQVNLPDAPTASTQPAALAVTGSRVTPIAVTSVAVILVGVALVILARRRRQPHGGRSSD